MQFFDPGAFAVRDLARVFKALSEPPRLQILALVLRHGELCGCEVERFLDLSQSAASRHLRVLRDAELLEDRRDGQWVYYGLPSRPVRATSDLLALLRERLTDVDVPDVGSDLLAMRAVRCSPDAGRRAPSDRAGTGAEVGP